MLAACDECGVARVHLCAPGGLLRHSDRHLLPEGHGRTLEIYVSLFEPAAVVSKNFINSTGSLMKFFETTVVSSTLLGV